MKKLFVMMLALGALSVLFAGCGSGGDDANKPAENGASKKADKLEKAGSTE